MAAFSQRSRSHRAAPRATTVAVAILTALAVACEGASAVLPSGAGGTGNVPAAGLLADADLRYGCGEFGFDPSILEQRGNAEQGDDPIAVTLRAHLALPGPDFDILPDTGWLLVGADDQRAQLIARDDRGALMSVSLSNGAEGWKVDGWGDCGLSLVLPRGIGRADWLPDPEAPTPDAATRAFAALVTERSCASGQPSVGRVVGPAVRYEEDRVLVVFGARPPPGGGFQTCPGNPPTRVVIDLGQPLGDRELIDAGQFPYVDVRSVDPFE